MDLLSQMLSEIKKIRDLPQRQRWGYILDYHKTFLALCVLALLAGAYAIYHRSSSKDILLYTALVNIAPSPEFAAWLDTEYLAQSDGYALTHKIQRYENLYLTEDNSSPHFPYAHASSLKILASIEARHLDLVLMDKEAFDAFAQNGFLYDLNEALAKAAPEWRQRLSPYLTDNIVLSDDGQPPSSQTKAFGLNLSQSKGISSFQMNGTIYVGIVANTPRLDAALAYAAYLFG